MKFLLWFLLTVGSNRLDGMNFIQDNSKNVFRNTEKRNETIAGPKTSLYSRLSGDTPDCPRKIDLNRIHSGVAPENSKIPAKYRRTDPICSLSGVAPDFSCTTEWWSGRTYTMLYEKTDRIFNATADAPDFCPSSSPGLALNFSIGERVLHPFPSEVLSNFSCFIVNGNLCCNPHVFPLRAWNFLNIVSTIPTEPTRDIGISGDTPDLPQFCSYQFYQTELNPSSFPELAPNFSAGQQVLHPCSSEVLLKYSCIFVIRDL